MTSYTNINGGSVIQTADRSLNQIVLNQNKELVWLTQFQDTQLVVAMIIDVTGQDIDDRVLTLPDATLTSVGQSILINNIGGHKFILHRNDGSVLVADFAVSASKFFYLHDNSATALPSPRGGDWRQGLNNSNISVTSVGLDVPNGTDAANIVVTNSPITTFGVMHAALGADLLALTRFVNNTGFSVRTAVNTWELRNITGTLNHITVANGDGIAGNPVISLPTLINANITNIIMGDLQIGVNPGNPGVALNTIRSRTANSSIYMLPDGSGELVVEGNVHIQNSKLIRFQNGNTNFYNSFGAGNLTANLTTLLLPVTNPTPGQVLGMLTATQMEWKNIAASPGITTPNTIAIYVDGIGTFGPTTVGLNPVTNAITNVSSISVSVSPLSGLTIGIADTQTISSLNNLNIVLRPNGVGRALASGIANAWARIAVDGANNPTILNGSAYNISGVVSPNPGEYLLTFANNFSNTSYCGVANVITDGGLPNAVIATMSPNSVSQAYVIVQDLTTGVRSRPAGFSVVFFQLLP